MIWWLAIRRVRMSLLAVGLLAVIIVVVGELTITMPALGSVQGLALPASLLSPLIVSTSVSHGLARGDAVVEAAAVRPVHRLDTAYAVSIALLALGVAGGLHVVGWSTLGLAAGRNALGFIGLAMIGRRFVGRDAASVVPAAAALLIAFFGGDTVGAPEWWAWIARPTSDIRSWIIAGGLLAVGVIAVGVSVPGRGVTARRP